MKEKNRKPKKIKGPPTFFRVPPSTFCSVFFSRRPRSLHCSNSCIWYYLLASRVDCLCLASLQVLDRHLEKANTQPRNSLTVAERQTRGTPRLAAGKDTKYQVEHLVGLKVSSCRTHTHKEEPYSNAQVGNGRSANDNHHTLNWIDRRSSDKRISRKAATTTIAAS